MKFGDLIHQPFKSNVIVSKYPFAIPQNSLLILLVATREFIESFHWLSKQKQHFRTCYPIHVSDYYLPYHRLESKNTCLNEGEVSRLLNNIYLIDYVSQ
jgi:hypothetical protein